LAEQPFAILVVEDSRALARDIQKTLVSLGYDVAGVASSAEEAIARAAEKSPDLVLMDITIKGALDGITTAEILRTRFGLPVIYLSSRSDLGTIDRAKKTEPQAFLVKPASPAELRSAIEVAMYRHGLEKRLRESEARHRQLFEHAPDPILITDPAGARIVDASPAACQVLGYTRDELIGKSVADLVPPEETARFLAARARVREPGSDHVAEWLLTVRDGSVLPFEVSTSTLPDGHRQAFLRDIRERKRAERELGLLLDELEAVLESTPDPMVIRMSGRIEYANPAFARVLGYAAAGEVTGKLWRDMVLARERAASDASALAMDQGDPPPTHHDLTMLAKDGSEVPLEMAHSRRILHKGAPAALLIMHDMRERQKLEAVLRTRDRMVTVGTLAAGVGHEINNPLTYVLANLDLMAEDLRTFEADSSPGKARELAALVAEARDGADRVRKIVRGLNTFARGEREERVEVDLRSVLEMAISLSYNELRQHIQVVKDFHPIPTVTGDESRLAQVFINLLVNAAQAMASRPIEQNVVRVSTATDAQGRAVVEVKDNGPGMAPEVASRVFEPFFTTKAIGQGSGLGLSIAHNIVNALGGEITVAATPGEGTAFTISLPATKAGDARRGPSAHPEPKASRRGSVLVVDDEPTIGSSVQRILHDHEVTQTLSATHALDLLMGDRRYDVVLCDLMMPMMTGMDLYERLARDRPRVAERMVFISGGVTETRTQKFLDEVPNERLEKPFSMQNLRSLVRRMIDATH
jgi:two-component system cell cycle sensor histidine kinase/response regulator CckA